MADGVVIPRVITNELSHRGQTQSERARRSPRSLHQLARDGDSIQRTHICTALDGRRWTSELPASIADWLLN